MTVDPTNGGAYVQITLSKVYDEVIGSRKELQDLVATVRPMAAQVMDHETRIRVTEQTAATKLQVDKLELDVEKKLEAVGERLTAGERWRYMAGGVITVVSMGGGAVISRLIAKH